MKVQDLERLSVYEMARLVLHAARLTTRDENHNIRARINEVRERVEELAGVCDEIELIAVVDNAESD